MTLSDMKQTIRQFKETQENELMYPTALLIFIQALLDND